MQTLTSWAEPVAFWIGVIGFIIIMIAGVRDRVVIYFDTMDFWISFLPWLVLFIGVGIATPDGMQKPLDLTAPPEEMLIPLYITYTVIAVCMVEIIRRSIRYNRNIWIGVCTAIFKVFFAIFAVIGLIGSVGNGANSRHTADKRVMAAVFFAVLYTLWQEFINGKDVYRQKGWRLSERDRDRFELR